VIGKALRSSPTPEREGPLFQDLLKACAHRTGTPKTEPFFFDWTRIQPAKLASEEKRRQRIRRNSQAHKEERTRRAREHGQDPATAHKRACNQTAYRIRHAVELAPKHAAEERIHRKSETGIRWSERQVQLNYIAAARAKRRMEKRAQGLVGLALKDLEAPTYKIQRAGRQTTEAWPLKDYAAAFIRAAELRAELTGIIAETRRLLASRCPRPPAGAALVSTL
jgi:hypothetical protein